MKSSLSRLHKSRHRLAFYLKHAMLSLKPRTLGQWQRQQLMHEFEQLTNYQQTYLTNRVDYYHKINTPIFTNKDFISAGQFKRKGHNSSYFLDLAALLPYFPQDIAFAYEFGDVTNVPTHPTLVKSRPIDTDNANAILLKLDSVRHFYITKDHQHFSEKKPKLVWRGAAHQSHRIRLLEQFSHHPLCDLGCVANRSLGKPYHKGFLSIDQQRQYQFILSIEGNDVATNLKWIMASQSLCFMTKPRYETWFMEGQLVPDQHYVLLRDDYADLPEKVSYYQQHPNDALAIIQQANHHVNQFFNIKQERLVQLLVMKKYTDLVKQTNS